ncbi:MAG: leucine-rich repeat protein [Christensenellales bacterium]|jgi:hypothetical protein
MNRKPGRILSLVLLSVLLLNAASVSLSWLSSAVAESPFVIENGVLVRYNGRGGRVKIPKGVTAIGVSVFQKRNDITGVTIPKGVKTIGALAFFDCKRLAVVTVPKGVTEIGPSAFAQCERLVRITVPEGVTKIEVATFSGCKNLNRISIPKSVTEIGDWAFSGCERLTRIAIPKGVETIGEGVFAGCERLARISVPSTVRTIGRDAFLACHNLAQVNMANGVETIGISAFSGCVGITHIILPGSVRSIEQYAFKGCVGLSGIVIPDGVTTIGKDAFIGCPNLRVVTVSKKMDGEMVENAFPGGLPEILFLPDDLLPPAIFLKVGQSMALPRFNGAKVVWRIDGEPIAGIVKNKSIKGVTEGRANLEMTVEQAAKGKALTVSGRPLKPGETYTIKLRVFGKKDATVRKVTASPQKLTLHPLGKGGYEKTAKITPRFTPATLPESDEWRENCLYISNNLKVAKVRSDGTIIAVRPGKARITVYAPNMKSARVSVAVKGFVTDIKLKKADGTYVNTLTLSKGNSTQLEPEFNEDAAFTALRWSSSKPAVATVNGYGKIVAVSKGKTKITATALDDSRKKATVIVTVTEAP